MSYILNGTHHIECILYIIWTSNYWSRKCLLFAICLSLELVQRTVSSEESEGISSGRHHKTSEPVFVLPCLLRCFRIAFMILMMQSARHKCFQEQCPLSTTTIWPRKLPWSRARKPGQVLAFRNVSLLIIRILSSHNSYDIPQLADMKIFYNDPALTRCSRFPKLTLYSFL